MPSPANRRDLSQYDRTLDGTEEAFISDNERRNQLFREVFNLVLIRDDNSDGLVNQSHVSCRSQSAAQTAQHPDAITYILYKASVIETMTDTTHPNHNAGEGHYSIRSISLFDADIWAIRYFTEQMLSDGLETSWSMCRTILP